MQDLIGSEPTDIVTRWLGRREYGEVLEAMQLHTRRRAAALARRRGQGGDNPASDEAMAAGDSDTEALRTDALWLVEHEAVFTLGQAADVSHVLDAGGIPVVRSDRGGEVTYHGPGQAVVYVLIELGRYELKVRALVNTLEQVVIDYLARYDIAGKRRSGAPGVYVQGRKIAALGLRVSRGFTYHGLSFNVDMDLSPFRRIDPCGFPGLETTQLRDFIGTGTVRQCATDLAAGCVERLQAARRGTT